jgi:hypothetical protein
MASRRLSRMARPDRVRPHHSAAGCSPAWGSRPIFRGAWSHKARDPPVRHVGGLGNERAGQTAVRVEKGRLLQSASRVKPCREQGGFGAVVHLEFAEDAAEVVLDRLLADEQPTPRCALSARVEVAPIHAMLRLQLALVGEGAVARLREPLRQLN